MQQRLPGDSHGCERGHVRQKMNCPVEQAEGLATLNEERNSKAEQNSSGHDDENIFCRIQQRALKVVIGENLFEIRKPNKRQRTRAELPVRKRNRENGAYRQEEQHDKEN